MQAHLYHPRLTIIVLTMLTATSLSVFETGCTSSNSDEYRKFSAKVDQRDQEASSTESIDAKAIATVQTVKPTALKSETVKKNETHPKTETGLPQSPTKDNTKNQVETAQKIERKALNDEIALVARRPDPKERALTEQEKKELSTIIKPREVKVLIKNRTFRKTSPGDALRVSYDDIDLLKVLNMEPVTANAPELMPQWLKELDGQRIRIRGFMYPPYQQTGNEFFMLARDNQICCFGKNPKIYDLFPVVMRDGESTDYILNRPFDVVGTFHIKSETIDGEANSELERIYSIDDAIVIDK